MTLISNGNKEIRVSNKMSRWCVRVLIFLLKLNAICAVQLLGVPILDGLSFNKTVKAFKYALVKFDAGYPTGQAHSVWAELGQELSEVDDLLLAEVRIKEYGDKENVEFRSRFNLPQVLPEILLFKGQTEMSRYGAELTLAGLRGFIEHKTGLHLSRPGCLEDYDQLAKAFVTASTAKERLKVREKAEKKTQEEGDETRKAKATKYLKLMRLIESKGMPGLRAEKTRVAKLQAEKMAISPDKLAEFSRTMNVIEAFSIHEKDEL